MHRPGRIHARIEFDLAKRAFVSGNILLQEAKQRLGLLRTQVDALKILDFNLALALLLKRSENQEEIPDVDSHLHAVGVGFAIIGRIT
jgi:hypothetical protein